MIAYLENLKKSARKLLELISEFMPAVRYVIHSQKSIAFLYASDMQLGKKSMGKKYLTLSSNKTHQILNTNLVQL